VETARIVMSAFWALCQIAANVVLISVNRRAASGRLPRNPTTGLRTPAMISSDKAWVAGHRAALRLTPVNLVVLAATLIALLAVVLFTQAMGLAMIVGLGGLLAVVPLAIYSTVVANRAAKLAEEQPDERQQQ
jgi:hypothetical protein